MFALRATWKGIFFPTSQHVSESSQSAKINRGVTAMCSTLSLLIKEGGVEKYVLGKSCWGASLFYHWVNREKYMCIFFSLGRKQGLAKQIHVSIFIYQLSRYAYQCDKQIKHSIVEGGRRSNRYFFLLKGKIILASQMLLEISLIVFIFHD